MPPRHDRPDSAVTPTELAIYATEVKLQLLGLASLARACFATALVFAFFFGTVSPRLRRAWRRSKRLELQIQSLRTANTALKDDMASGAVRIIALEQANAAFEKEVQRFASIRKRTGSSLLETTALPERLQTVTAHVDMP